RSPMPCTHSHRLLAVRLVVAAACSRRTNEAVAPAAAPPGSIMTEEEIARAPGRPIEQLLMDRFPGVMVSRTPDGGLSIRIRGVSSFHSSNEPLCVVDDVPRPADQCGALNGHNPHGIAT